MKKMWVLTLTAAMTAGMMLAGCGEGKSEGSGSSSGTEAGSQAAQAAESAAGDEGGEKVIGVSIMNLQAEFFQDLRAGIEENLPEGYSVDFNDANNDLNKQLSAVENFCANKVDAIILNAVDAEGIVTALDTAEEAGIPVICVDMKPTSGSYVTYIGSDNYLGGELAAEWAVQNLFADNDSPSIALLTNSNSSAATLRISGFKDKITELLPDVEIVAEETGNTREEFMTTAENILTAHSDLDLFFAYSESGGLGAYDAIEIARREEVSIIGFDASAEEQTAIGENGCYKASIIQFPQELGKTCVEAVESTLSGETLENEIGVEVGVYTADGIVYASDLEQ